VRLLLGWRCQYSKRRDHQDGARRSTAELK
jgi:hypothetical protein